MTALLGLPVGYEWVVLLVVALLLFGGTRVAGMGKGAGRAIREFKEELKAPAGIEEVKAESAPAEPVHRVPEALDTEVTRQTRAEA